MHKFLSYFGIIAVAITQFTPIVSQFGPGAAKWATVAGVAVAGVGKAIVDLQPLFDAVKGATSSEQK